MLLALLLLPALGAPAQAAPTAITEAPPLEWGFKLSWRIYATEPEVSGGATIVPQASAAGHTIGWAFDGGSYDAETRTTVLRYRGSARWTGHPALDEGATPPPGYDGPLDIDLLDLTVTDPVVTISRDVATISATTTSRDGGTWRMVDYGRIPIVDLAADAVTPQVADGTTSWTQIPAAIAAAAGPAFGEVYYQPGTPVDPVSLSYSGDGGAPDFSDSFDAEGWTRLAPVGDNALVAPATTQISNFELFATDPGRQLAYYRVWSDEESAWTLRAFDLAQMRAIGDPLVAGDEELGALLLNDTTSGRLYVATADDGYARHWVRYDRDAGSFVTGDDADAMPAVADNTRIPWDPVGERAFEIVRTVPDGVADDAYDEHQWQLRTYTRDGDDAWTAHVYDLPNAPAHLNQALYQTSFATAASDGSLIVLGDARYSDDDGTEAPATVPGAFRIVTDGAEATVTPIAGTTVANDWSALFDLVATGDDGRVALVDTRSPGRVQQLDVTPAGGGAIEADAAVALDFPNSIGGELMEGHVALDATDGTVWLSGKRSRRIVGVRAGSVVADQALALHHPRAGALIAAPDGTLVMQSGDGTDDSGSQAAFGFQRLERLGDTATVTADPADRAVTLPPGSDGEQVSFSAAATGTPAPTIRWQAKGPAATRFRDLDGETAATLTVTARAGMGGTSYRAVFTNAAGRVASEPATLTVDYAPRVSSQPLDQTVTAGSSATFQLLADGSPEPAIAWEREVGGAWVPLSAGDGVRIAGGTLTIERAALDWSGTRLRASVTNAAGAVSTRAATLTVVAARTIPPSGLDLQGVVLEWSGNDELQKAPPFGGSNYFSAGVSAGDEATYGAAAGDVRILHVDGAGAATPASWATRAAQVAGGVTQLVRLDGGRARIEPDGSATVRWRGSFSVNFYGGLVPFTFTDPLLTVDASGNGRLVADMSGYASSQANPNERSPLAPVAGVTVATFSGLALDPAGRLTVAPDYAGVEVALPGSVPPQSRDGEGWGAWPQAFVDFHVATGLASYWYTSGGVADRAKAPRPFVVDFSGATVPPPVEQPPGEPPVKQPPVVKPPLRRAPTKVTVKAAKSVRLAGLRRKGLLVRVTVPRRARLALTLSARLPRHRRATALARASRSTAKATTVRLRLKAGRAAARKLRLALKRKHRVTATVVVKTTLAGGKPTTKRLRITIRR